MSADHGQPSLNPPAAGEFPPAGETNLPENWVEAISCLISSRVALIQAESKDAVADAIGKIVLLAVAAFSLVLVWLLVVAGVIGAVSEASGWEWFYVTFAVAGVHALVAVIVFLMSRAKTSGPSFPVTRSEFEKDREWLNQLNKKRNSEN